MLELLVFALYVVGGTYVITESTIVQPGRVVASVHSLWLDVFLHCPKCIAFWVAAAMTLCGYTPPLAEGAPLILRFLWTGLCGIAVALIAVNASLLGNESESEREVIAFLRDVRAREKEVPPENQVN